MKLTRLLAVLAGVLPSIGFAQNVVLNDFSNFVTGETTFFSGTWSLGGSEGELQGRSSFSQGDGIYNFVGGTNADSSKVEFYFDADGSTVDVTSAVPSTSVYLSGMLGVGNAATSLVVSLIDSNGTGAQAVFDLTAFLSDSITTITTTATPDNATFMWTAIQSVVISGGQIGGTPIALSVSIDELGVGNPIPEPSTYAMIAGVLAIGLAAYRRRSTN